MSDYVAVTLLPFDMRDNEGMKGPNTQNEEDRLTEVAGSRAPALACREALGCMHGQRSLTWVP